MSKVRKILVACSITTLGLCPVAQGFAQGVAQGSSQGFYNYQTGRVENAAPYQQSGSPSNGQDWGYAKKRHFYSGDWSLTLGGTVYSGPKYLGSNSYEMKFSPIISLGKAGDKPRFVSRNDNPSFALLDSGALRLGATGKIIWHRDEDQSSDLYGLDPIKAGAEIGAFAELYPFDGLRIRTELRHGIRSHDALTLDLAVDAYQDITPTIRVSGGPRAFYAGDDYFKTYYGVNTLEAQRSGLKKYKPSSGWGSVGVGGAINWKTTDKIDTSLFAEYNRLTGPAADSSLVNERGSKDQMTFGISASYRFDFHVD